MGRLQQITHDLRVGLARLRFGTARAANRVLEETELLKLRLEAHKLDRRITDLCRDIGERAVELHERGEPSAYILSDWEIARAAEQVMALKAERDKLTTDMDDVLSGN